MQNLLKIPLFLIPYHKIGGAEKVHLEIIKSLPSKPVVFFYNLSDGAITEEFGKHAHCFYIDSPKRKRALYLGLTFLSNFYRPIFFGCNSYLYYELICKLKNRTFNIDLTHAFCFPEKGIETATVDVAQYLHKRLVINERTLQDYKKLYEMNGVDPQLINRIEIIPNGVDIKDFDHNTVQKRFHNFTIGFVGRNSYEKRPEVFFQCVQNLQMQNIESIVIGNDFTEFKNAFPNVKYFENSNDPTFVRNAFQNIGVLIISSYREGFPLVIMEAMELGIPVIATPVGSISDHVINGVNGYVAPDVDASSFVTYATDKITALQNDEVLYNTLCTNAREYAVKHFDIAVFREKYRRVFKSYLSFYKK